MQDTRQQPRTRITAQARALRFDAGSLCLNLVATLGRRGATTALERLDDVPRLRAWCAGVGLTLRSADTTPEFVEALRELRAAAFDVVHAAIRDQLPRPAAVALINELAAVEPPAPRLRPDARPQDGPELTAAQLRSVIARDLIAVLGDPKRRSRLRECDADICRMIYLDSGHGRPRKWCSMQRCGNNAKAAQHRRRATA